MAKKPQKKLPFVGTYGRILLSKWSPLNQLIDHHSRFVKEQQQDAIPQKPARLEPNFDMDFDLEDDFFSLEPENSPPTGTTRTLTKAHIDDALRGPYQEFFKTLLNAYAIITRLRFELHVVKEDVFKGQRATLDPADQIDSQLVSSTKFSELDKAQEEVNRLCHDYYEKWSELCHASVNELIRLLSQQDVSLTEMETKEFHDEEPMSELLARFTEVGLPIDKIDFTAINFSNYLQLKTKLTVYNSLARQHQPHDANALAAILKHNEKFLAELHKEEKKLLTNQQKAVKAILNPFL